MPFNSITDLAPELIIQILKSSDNFADATSLSVTSRRMFTIWKMNVDSICEAILPRVIDCFEQARELLTAQERPRGEKDSVLCFQSAIDRVRWMLKRADIAAEAAAAYLKHGTMCRGETYTLPVEREMSMRADRTDFIRAHYRATTLATLEQEQLPSQILSSWSMLDIEHVVEVMEWLIFGCFTFCDGRLQEASQENWLKLFDSMLCLRSDLHGLIIKPGESTSMEEQVRAHCQDPYMFDKVARLADLLPLVREKGTWYNNGYTLSEE